MNTFAEHILFVAISIISLYRFVNRIFIDIFLSVLTFFYLLLTFVFNFLILSIHTFTEYILLNRFSIIKNRGGLNRVN